MNKKLKKILATAGGIVTVFILSSCNSFCSTTDTSNFRYVYDPINTTFFTSKSNAYEDIIDDFVASSGLGEDKVNRNNLIYIADEDSNTTFKYSDDIAAFESALFTTYNENLVSVNPGKIQVKVYNEETEEEETYNAFIGLNSLNVTLINNAVSASYVVPSYTYFKEIDNKTLSLIVDKANSSHFTNLTINSDFSNLTFEMLYGYSSSDYRTYKSLEDGKEKDELLDKLKLERENNSILANFGYVKHYSLTIDDEGNETVDYYANIDKWNNELANELGNDAVMSQNYYNAYTTQLNTNVANVKSCITVNDGFYGNLTDDPLNNTIFIEGKAEDFWEGWGRAFSEHGFLEGLLVYPIGVGVENLSHAFGMNGYGQIGALILMTFIVRGLFMLVTLPSTISQQKMQYIQPEILKLQQKYPNSDTDQSQKERLSRDTLALYKKNKIHPWLSILILIIQLPLFVSVWNAFQGSASLATDAVLGLNLSDSIWSVLTDFSGWPSQAGWWTALVLIILMSAAQIVSMLLPNWLSKRRTKNVTKTVKSSITESTQKTNKYMQWGMTIFVIIMGFTLPAAMGVYWFAGAIFSIIQTLIINLVFSRKKKGTKGAKK